jgi:transcriptional regulator with XRE-family HTH domain
MMHFSSEQFDEEGMSEIVRFTKWLSAKLDNSDNIKNREFGEELVSLQSKLGVSNIELAKHLGVTPATIGKWRTGSRSASSQSIFLLLNLLNECVRSSSERSGVDAGENSPDLATSNLFSSERVNRNRVEQWVLPAHTVFQQLAYRIPNDISEEHRSLLLNLAKTISDLVAELSEADERNLTILEENQRLQRKIDSSLPVLRQGWTTFVASAAGAATGVILSQAGSYAVGYTAGYISGVVHDKLAPIDACLV